MKKVFVSLGAALSPVAVFAQEAEITSKLEKLETTVSAAQSNADNSWMLICTALVLLMTKPSIIGAVSGSVAGLVCITPAVGFVSPMAALVIGIVGGTICYFAVNELKRRFGYDDTLDVFGIHGIAGISGALLTGIFATSAINLIFKDAGGAALPVGLIDGNAMQIVNQLIAVGLTIVLAAAGSFILLKLVDLIVGVRVSEEHEIAGLDASQHGEIACSFIAAEMFFDTSEGKIESSPTVISSQTLALDTAE